MTASQESVLTLRYKHPRSGQDSPAQEHRFKVVAGMDPADLDGAIRLMFGLSDDEGYVFEDSTGCKLMLSKATMACSGTFTMLVVRKAAAKPFSPAPNAFAKRVSSPESSHNSHSARTVETSESIAETASFPDYPDGDKSWTTTVTSSKVKDLYYLGWAALWQKSRDCVKYRRCLGVFECPVADCKFVKRPPCKKKRLAAAIGVWQCKFHTDQVRCCSRIRSSFHAQQILKYSDCKVSMNIRERVMQSETKIEVQGGDALNGNCRSCFI